MSQKPVMATLCLSLGLTDLSSVHKNVLEKQNYQWVQSSVSWLPVTAWHESEISQTQGIECVWTESTFSEHDGDLARVISVLKIIKNSSEQQSDLPLTVAKWMNCFFYCLWLNFEENEEAVDFESCKPFGQCFRKFQTLQNMFCFLRCEGLWMSPKPVVATDFLEKSSWKHKNTTGGREFKVSCPKVDVTARHKWNLSKTGDRVRLKWINF